MRHLLNAMRREASNVLGDVALPSTGIVRSYDPNKYAVRLELQPQGNLTGWIPLQTPWVGDGWGMFCPPTIGDLLEVAFLNGDIDSGVAGLRFYNDQDRPLSVPSGEFWLVHKSGSFLKFHNDGSIDIHAAGNINSSAAAWNHTGPMNVTGAITGTSTITAPNVIGTTNVTFGGKSGIGHTHSGVQTGSGNTGAPV